MRISKAKAQENRARVLDVAAELFCERGFEAVGVAEAMHAAGLTHGGFYNHFESKEALEAAACTQIFAKSVARMEAIADQPDAQARAKAYAAYRARYVSPEARDASAASCPMVAFAGDVRRQPDPVRQVYAEGLRAYLAAFAKASGEERTRAIRNFAELVGTLTLARSVAAVDRELSDEILAATRLDQTSAIADTSRP